MKIIYLCAKSNYKHLGIKSKLDLVQNFYIQNGINFEIVISPESRYLPEFYTSKSAYLNSADVVIARGVLFAPNWFSTRQNHIYLDRHVFHHKAESKKDYIRLNYERIWDPFKFASGVFYVTNEMKIIDSKVLAAIAIGNASTFEVNDELNVVKSARIIGMSIGAFDSSHGVDILMEISKLNSFLQFEIVTNQEDSFRKLSKYATANLSIRKAKSREEYKHILQSWSVAIGPLAISRRNLNEAAPLKVRDYVSYGIPTFINYIDTNLSAVSIHGLFESKSGINPSLLSDDLNTFMETRKRLIPDLALKNAISIRTIENQRLNFILEKNSNN